MQTKGKKKISKKTRKKEKMDYVCGIPSIYDPKSSLLCPGFLPFWFKQNSFVKHSCTSFLPQSLPPTTQRHNLDIKYKKIKNKTRSKRVEYDKQEAKPHICFLLITPLTDTTLHTQWGKHHNPTHTAKIPKATHCTTHSTKAVALSTFFYRWEWRRCQKIYKH